MDLGFIKDMINDIKDNEVIQSFVKELGDFLENTTSKLKESSGKIDSLEILNQIENNRNVSVVSRNQIRDGIDNIIENNNNLSKEELISEIKEMSNSVLDKQDEKLNEYRKEGHLYMVEEDTNDRIYLWDITDKPSITIEEVDFPENLKEFATEGSVFQYLNGEYKIYNR